MSNVRRSTYSERKVFKACRRRWYLGTYRRFARAREEIGAATLGTRVHEVLGVHYDPKDVRKPLEVFEARAAADLGACDPADEKALTGEIEYARAMVEGYFEWLAESGADEDLNVLSAEEAIEATLGEIRGRIVTLLSKQDVRVQRRSDDAVLFMDHKTVQSFEERVNLLHLDEQMKSYHLCEYLLALAGVDAYASGARTDGALYNMLRKVKRSLRAKPPFYAREEQHHNMNVLRSYWYQVWGEMEEILRVEDALDAGADHRVVAPPNPTRDCSWSCPFLPVCPMFDDSSMQAERVLESAYVEIDPLARYGEDLDTRTS